MANRRRQRRRNRPRPISIAQRGPMRFEVRQWLRALAAAPLDPDCPVVVAMRLARPRSRAHCVRVQRPCPWVACAHHLYLDVAPTTGSIKLNFPDLDPDELPATCALDVADRGAHTLEEVGEAMNLTRERVRQLERRALLKVKAAADPAMLAALLKE